MGTILQIFVEVIKFVINAHRQTKHNMRMMEEHSKKHLIYRKDFGFESDKDFIRKRIKRDGH